MAATVEREGGDKPVCVAEIVFRYYDMKASRSSPARAGGIGGAIVERLRPTAGRCTASTSRTPT